MLNLVLLFLSAVVVTVTSSCSQADIRKAFTCTAGLHSGTPGQGFVNFLDNQGDANWMVVACGNGDLLTAINCIERVMVQCKDDNSDVAHFLRKMIDIESYRRVVNFFCTNVRVYTANAGCVASQHAAQDACAGDAKRNYETQKGATSNMDALMRFQCKFYQAVVVCAEKVLTKNCSSDAVDIVKTVLLGLQPPICATLTGVETGRPGIYDVHRSDGSNRAGRSHSHAGTVMCMLLLAVGFFICFI